MHSLRLEQERLRQLNRREARYFHGPDPSLDTYWQTAGPLPFPDVEEMEILTNFARQVVEALGGRPLALPASEVRAPDDIYPVY